jgi:hypothetical protein
MRIAILSDTHMPRGKRRLPVERLRDADLILHAGDLSTVAVLEELESIGPPVAAVVGNVDEPALARRLPVERVIEAEGARIAMIHDAGPSKRRIERMRARFPDADAVVFGHSHIPLHSERDGFQIFNPGSATDRRRQPRHTMGYADVSVGGNIAFTLIPLD